MFAHESHQSTVTAPGNVFDRWAADLADSLLLLDIIENDGGSRAEDQARGSTVEDFVSLYGGLDRFHDRV